MLKRSFSLMLFMLLIGTVISLSAQSSSSPMASAEVENPLALGGAHVLYQTFVNYGNAVAAVGAGFQPLDAVTTVFCPGTGPCTIGAEQNVQINDTKIGNRWAICTQVDGVFMSTPNCPFQGFTNNNGTEYLYHTGSFAQHTAGVTRGFHRVQTFVYSDAGLNESIYTIIYRVYRP